MKRLVLGTAGILSLAALNPAAAADLSRRYQPPPVQQAPIMAQVYNWTGFYIGVNGGGGVGQSDWSRTGNFDISGGLVGGTVGYNWQTGPRVLGVAGDIDWSDINGSTFNGCAPGCKTSNDCVQFAVNNQWSLKAEYLYVDLGIFACGMIPNEVGFTSHIGRAGVNYRF